MQLLWSEVHLSMLEDEEKQDVHVYLEFGRQKQCELKTKRKKRLFEIVVLPYSFIPTRHCTMSLECAVAGLRSLKIRLM